MTTPPTPHKVVIVFFFNYYKMFRANTPISLYRPPPSYNGGGSSVMIFSFGMMLLLMMAVAFFLLLVYLKRKKREKTFAERMKNYENNMEKRRQSIRKANKDLGLEDEDTDDILDSLKSECLTYPVNDACDARYYELKDGCCVLKAGMTPSRESEQSKMIRQMALEMGALVFAEILVTSVIPKMANRLRNVLRTVLRQIIKKTISAVVARFAIRAAMMVTRVLTKLSSGPVGWALLIFDIIAEIINTADLKNYDSFISNDSLMEGRNVMIYKFNEAMATLGEDYPMLFPFAELFPKESGKIAEEMQVYIEDTYVDEYIEAGGADYILKVFESREVEGGPPPKDPPTEEEFLNLHVKWNELVRTKDAKKLDKMMFDLLQQEIPVAKRKDIFLVPSMSTVNTYGISISEEAAITWNKKQQEEWFTYLDPIYPPNIPSKDWTPPISAIYTNRYMKLNTLKPGNQHNPNIVYDTLPQKVTLAYPFGPLYVMCEKPRTSMKYKRPVDPREYGVTFNFENGVCEFTKKYCDRYVIDYVSKTWGDGTPYKDCKLSNDQKWAENFLGTAVVRDAKRYWNDPGEIIKDVDQVYKDRKEKHGPVMAALMMVQDPLGWQEGFAQNIQEKLAGKDKYCITGDTCKRFKAKHGGGNIMTWSARDAENQVYPNATVGFQGQVKTNEDHEFFVPEGGRFRVKCDPGGGKYFSYDELPDDGNTRKFTCWGGSVDKPADKAIFDAANDGLVEAGNFLYDTAPKAVGKFVTKTAPKAAGKFLNDNFNKDSVSRRANDSWNAFIGLLSDRRLKKNIKSYKDFYTWEWNDTARTLYGLYGKDFGYITDTLDPRYVAKDSYGYEYIITGSPVHKKLLQLKSQYKIK